MKTFCLGLVVFLTISCTQADNLPNAATPSGYSSYIWASNVQYPRSILTVSTGEILVLEQDGSRISCLWDDDKDGYSGDDERMVIVTKANLNHGLGIYGNYLYASSDVGVWRWQLSSSGIRTALSNEEAVVVGIPGQGHSTRTLEFMDDKIYVQCGSAGNLDSDASRSLIRRFDLNAIPSGGYQYTAGSVFAIGLRNEVGLRFDLDGGLWGVENGVDNLNRAPWGDIHENNPAEELNYFGKYDSAGGAFYGYPYCWSSYILPNVTQVGTQFAQLLSDSVHTDDWCQNTTNVVPPKLGMPAHGAPLSILFYNGSTLPGVNKGDAFVALHGSWNRQAPQGYRVLHIPFSNGNPTSFVPFFYSDLNTTSQAGPGWPYRPVGLAIADCEVFGECLLVSSDVTGEIIAIASGFNSSASTSTGVSTSTSTSASIGTSSRVSTGTSSPESLTSSTTGSQNNGCSLISPSFVIALASLSFIMFTLNCY